ncbi:NAD-dependent epimerase/dehydratase family protein [Nocardioides sp. URHA0032]|uniref:NAD-dependent epimerase/dehydratase family protein n=1 Tax=Nocardioides sp. URHA0032 TaxID=1380388 RepID=UPI00048EA40C|nr:NAD-dependent epimerase/dehydratase family protein [Nocardioides sp. URHA0032]
MRIAVTGASGNVGSALVDRLVDDGHEVVGIVRRPPDDDRLDWHRVDLTDEAQVPDLERSVQGADAVVHLAWGFQPSHRIDHLRALGVDGTRRVAEAAVRAGVPHLVHQSSVGAYSPRRDMSPVREDHPTDGVESSPYSRHKAAAEKLLDEYDGRLTVTRMRPGIIGQRRAAGGLLRYAVPLLVPGRLLTWLPVLPLDDVVQLSMVHADDVADAIARVLDRKTGGAFNLTAGSVDADEIADVLGARRVAVPMPVLRAAASATWHLRLQQVDPGWVDLARHAPVIDASRAGQELGWTPRRSAREVLEEVVDSMVHGDAGDSAALRRRTVPREIGSLLRRGPVSRRVRP